jgi:hypothetical protein
MRTVAACLLGLALGIIGCLSFGVASEGFPSVSELQQQLPLQPGQPLPKQVMNLKTGQIFNVIYLRGRYLGNGRYDAELQLVAR